VTAEVNPKRKLPVKLNKYASRQIILKFSKVYDPSFQTKALYATKSVGTAINKELKIKNGNNPM
jgi:hypothetical protein